MQGCTEAGSEEWLAKVVQDVLSGPTVRVWWYYRASDLGMKDKERELFLSDHQDEVELNTIMGFVEVDVGQTTDGLYWRQLWFPSTKRVVNVT